MYKITDKQKETYQGIIILNEMINNHREFIINENLIVEPILLALKNKKLIKISGDQYIPTADGRINLQNFYNKFFEFEKVFYIFSAVDFEHGEFAFSKYWDLSEEEFDKYISEPRWYDCRIAVAEYKKMDVIEIVFMSFIKDDKFNLTDDKWEFSLANFETWNEIESGEFGIFPCNIFHLHQTKHIEI
jgi:hypothetical protein